MGVDLQNNQLREAGTLANPFSGTQYFTNIDASGNMGVKGELTIPKASPAAPANGNVWLSDSGLSWDLKFYDSYAGGPSTVVTDLTSLGGDVSGTIGNTTVVALQNQTLGALGDGQIHVYDASSGAIAQTALAGGGDTQPGWQLSAQSGGLFAWITDNAQINNGFAGNLGTGTGYSGNWIDFDFYMTSGTTWYLIVCYAQDANGSPSVDIQLDGVSLGTTLSCNAPLRTNNQFTEIVGFTVANPGKHTIRFIDIGPGPFEIAITEVGVRLA